MTNSTKENMITVSGQTQTPLRRGQRVRWNGSTWEVLAVDSDPTARAWIVSIDDPDRDAFVLPGELEGV